jgi:hypothetical protein
VRKHGRITTTSCGVEAGETQDNAPGGTRTHNLLIRSQALCPLELPGHRTLNL